MLKFQNSDLKQLELLLPQELPTIQHMLCLPYKGKWCCLLVYEAVALLTEVLYMLSLQLSNQIPSNG